MNQRLTRVALAALAGAALVSQLTACFPLVAGGAVMTGMVATDRRTSGAQVEDEGIELRAVNRLHEALGDGLHVNVTSYNRQVLLTGEATTAEAKQKAEQIVQRVENVRGVYNELVVGIASPLSDRSRDTLISGKVKASLVDARGLISNSFKVLTGCRRWCVCSRSSPKKSSRPRCPPRRRTPSRPRRAADRYRAPAGRLPGPRGPGPAFLFQRRRLIRLEVSQRRPPICCTSA